ncbi:MAG: hypothetical protein RBT04_08155 [Sphaerochaetaceae bacterium]|jgi:hypothetical protein|nr:hypothetical protein [Sphaerochaetaceae bacterium]
MKLQLTLGLGLGAHRKVGDTFNPLSLDGTVFLIDCKAAAQQEYVREVSGSPAFWTKLVNLANTDNSVEYAATANQALYQPDGGFGWHEAHQNSITTPIVHRTIILALKNENPEFVGIASAISSHLSNYNLIMASSKPDVGYGAGCGLYSGSSQTRKITTDTRVGNGASVVLTVRNDVAPSGTIRYNGIAQTLDDTGTNESTQFNGLPASAIASTARWRGTIYGMYCNTNVMSDTDIAKVEAWMRKRYNI